MFGPRNPRRRRLARYVEDTSGVAAVEMAIWLIVLLVPMLNIIDFGLYLFQRVQVENAAQMAAQLAWEECGQAGVPANTKCAYYATSLQRGAHGTTLGNSVGYSSTEGDYCVISGDLTKTGCTKTADYILVTTTYNYQPLFSAFSFASLLESPITSTTWRRMN